MLRIIDEKNAGYQIITKRKHDKSVFTTWKYSIFMACDVLASRFVATIQLTYARKQKRLFMVVKTKRVSTNLKYSSKTQNKINFR
jgi:hypothetical protein